MNIDSIKKRVEQYQVDGKTGMVMSLDVIQALLDRIDECQSVKLKWRVDGDQLCVVREDFISLQESPAMFLPADGDMATTLMGSGLGALTVDELRYIHNILVPHQETPTPEEWFAAEHIAHVETPHPGTQASGQDLPPCNVDGLREKFAEQESDHYLELLT